MRTLTIEIPDDIVDLLDTMPPDARNHFAVSALREAAEIDNGDADEFPLSVFQTHPLPVQRADLSPAHISAIEAGLADSDAGRVIDGETVFAALRQIVSK